MDVAKRCRYLSVLTLLLLLCACSPSMTNTASSQALQGQQIASGVGLDPTAAAKALPQPARLQIPAIGVNANIEQVGVDASGELAVPGQRPWEDVGWYRDGPLPGQRGSAVIDGHLDRPGDLPAVFWRLRSLQPGNQVLVTDTDGHKRTFQVIRLVYYPPAKAPLQQIFGDSSGTYLNLITCAGDWIPSIKQTTLRLVIYTKLVKK